MRDIQAERALTIHFNSARPNLRIDIEPPEVEERNGELVLTIGMSMTWESDDTKLESERGTQADATSSLMTTPAPRLDALSPVSSRFRNWYLCPKDGAEWSIEGDVPATEDSCPICGATRRASAILRLPPNVRQEPQGTKSKLTLRKGLGYLNRN